MKRGRVTVVTIFLLLGLLVGFNFSITKYLVQQGRGQLTIIFNTTPIQKVIDNPEFSDKKKNKIRLIEEVKQFAVDSIGLDESGSYTSYYDQRGLPVLWTVTACRRYKFEPYQWKFPVLGKLGYKGFFDKNCAEKEAERLSDLGYDTHVGEINAWSTLGWLNDPILSSMLNKSDPQLCRLIIHELTHATIYNADDADYNENLATFIGDYGAAYFMASKYGQESEEYVDYMNLISDLDQISTHFLNGKNQLEKLYKALQERTENTKIERKQKAISDIITSIDTLKLHHPNLVKHIKTLDELPNNTFFMTYKMYREQQRMIKEEFQNKFEGSFRNYMRGLKERY